jgi:subtilisin-like proprotein convertase family protein
VVYNNPSTNDSLVAMFGTDFVPIPAVFISNADGEALKNLIQTNAAAHVRINLTSATHAFAVTNTLVCEQVGVRVNFDHPLRGDLRLTLLSPQGTRSVLQAYNGDTSTASQDWTYWTTHDFFESSYGNWTVVFSDESEGYTGRVVSAELIIRGVEITDTDHDGLSDSWEMTRLGSLAYGPKDDPDNDGFCNAREQLMGTDPLAVDRSFVLDLSPWTQWGANLARVSWPGLPNKTYQVWAGTNVASLSLITNLPSQFPETVWFTPWNAVPYQFFRVKALP